MLSPCHEVVASHKLDRLSETIGMYAFGPFGVHFGLTIVNDHVHGVVVGNCGQVRATFARVSGSFTFVLSSIPFDLLSVGRLDQPKCKH